MVVNDQGQTCAFLKLEQDYFLKFEQVIWTNYLIKFLNYLLRREIPMASYSCLRIDDVQKRSASGN